MAADVVFDIIARDKASAAFKSAGDNVDTLGSKLGGVAKSALALGGGAAVAGFVKGAISGAQESAKVAAQSAAVIKSTGGAANVTAKQMADLAGSISAKTGVDDEAIQSASNLLATFTNVRNEAGKGNKIFDSATATLVDMSAALGTDVSAGAVQLGKALNDPIKGISALSRVGVTFTDQQKAQIKAMQEAGDMAGAQKVILAELGKEFGGSAEAQATAGAKLSVAFGNLQEKVGGLLVPVLERLAAIGIKVADWISNASPVTLALAGGVAALGAAVVVIIQAQKAWTAVQAGFNIVMSANPIGLIILAVAALAVGLVVAYQKSETFRDIVDGAMKAAGAAISWLWETAKTIFGYLKDLFLNFTPIGVLISNFDTLKNTVTTVATAISEAFKAAFNFIADAWNNTLGKISVTIPDWVPELGGKSFSVPDIPKFETASALARTGAGGTLAGIPTAGGAGSAGFHVENLNVNGGDRPAETAEETANALRRLAYLGG